MYNAAKLFCASLVKGNGMPTKSVRVGLVGQKFMGRAHSNASLKVAKFFDVEPAPVMTAVCGRDEKELAEFAKRWGWQGYETDWKKLVARNDIDLVDVSTPGNLHHDMVIAAARAGKQILCEKPLANSLNEARAMLDAVRKAGVIHMLCHN